MRGMGGDPWRGIGKVGLGLSPVDQGQDEARVADSRCRPHEDTMTTILYILLGIVGVVVYFLLASVVGRAISGTRKWEE